MRKIRGILENKIIKDRNIEIYSTILLSFGFSFCFIGFFLSLFLAADISGGGIVGFMLAIVLGTMVPLCIAYIFFRIMMIPFSLMDFCWKKGNELSKLINNESSGIFKIDELLKKVHDLYRNIRVLIGFKRVFGFIFTHTTIKALNIYFETTQINALNILKTLRSDLSNHLTEQQKSLESAKSEVSTHLKGSSELEQVSELQKARLDHQIEQFEELQKVLVKM